MSTAGILMMLASAGSPTLVTKTFNASENWVVPAGVTQLESVSGRGAFGTPYSERTETLSPNFETFYSSSGSGQTAGQYTWASLNNQLNAARNGVNTGGSSTVITQLLLAYPSSYTLTNSGAPFSGAIAGSATIVYSGAWGTSGNVTSSGTAQVNYRVGVPATTGASASGFGRTFPGGVGGASTVQNFGAQSVTPGTPMAVSVPGGGNAYITITYYQ